MKIKDGLIQIRCTHLEKKKIQNAASNLGLSTSSYILKQLDKQEIIVSLFNNFEDKLEDIKDNISAQYFSLKEDTEDILNKTEVEKYPLKLVDITKEIEDRLDLKLYKVNDILTLQSGKTYIVNYNNFKDEFHIQRIETEEVGELNIEKEQVQTLLNSLTKIQRKI